MAVGYVLLTGSAAVTMDMLRTGILPVLYLGVFSTCGCFFLQTFTFISSFLLQIPTTMPA